MKSKKNDMLDLQLFAQASDQLQNTTATLTAEMKTYYEKRLLDQAEPALVHNQFGDPYPIPANGGKTIELRRYDSLPKAHHAPDRGCDPQRPDPERDHDHQRPAPVWRLDPADRCAPDDGH